MNEQNKIFIITNTIFAVAICKERRGVNRGRLETKCTKWNRAERKESKKRCPGSSGIHLVSDICFFIAT